MSNSSIWQHLTDHTICSEARNAIGRSFVSGSVEEIRSSHQTRLDLMVECESFDSNTETFSGKGWAVKLK